MTIPSTYMITIYICGTKIFCFACFQLIVSFYTIIVIFMQCIPKTLQPVSCYKLKRPINFTLFPFLWQFAHFAGFVCTMSTHSFIIIFWLFNNACSEVYHYIFYNIKSTDYLNILPNSNNQFKIKKIKLLIFNIRLILLI